MNQAHNFGRGHQPETLRNDVGDQRARTGRLSQAKCGKENQSEKSARESEIRRATALAPVPGFHGSSPQEMALSRQNGEGPIVEPPMTVKPSYPPDRPWRQSADDPET